LSVVSLLPLL